MVVLILENVPPALRGELSRWMIEPRTGVFVGSVSGMVRDKLWEKVTKSVVKGGATLLHSSNTEQGFRIRTHGKTRRAIVDFEGLMLVSVPVAEDEDGDEVGESDTSEGQDQVGKARAESRHPVEG